tara:strand:+ start:14266 stop:14586 length:321 start_codon:yes stop_codon:yes gene_type:complete
MRLHQCVAVICLIQALIMCFVLSPIKAVAYSAALNKPAAWWVFDPNTAWLSLSCFKSDNPLACFQTISEIFQLDKAMAIRIGICLVAVGTGLLIFHWLRTKLSRDP